MKWVKASYVLGFISLIILLAVFQNSKSSYEDTENLLHLTYVAKDKIKDIKDSFYEVDIQLVTYSLNLNEVDRYIIAKDLLDLEDHVRELNQMLLELAKYEDAREVLDYLIQVDNRHFVDYFISRESTLSFVNKNERIYQGKIKSDLSYLEQLLQSKIDTILKQREARREVVRSYYLFLIGLSLCSFTLYAWSMYRETNRRNVLLNQLELAVASSKKNLELKNQFVANISHEIRTPLNGIIGVSKLLKENFDTDKRDFYLDLINNSGNLLLKIVNDLLDFSKADANKIDLELAEFDLVSIKEQVMGMFIQKIKNKSVRVYSEYDSKIKHQYLGDQSRITQIMSNLLGNAIKFTDSGFVNLKLSMQKENIAEGVDLIKCEVIDTGIGLSDEDMELLFQPFNQIKNKHSGEGTGLGLAISKRLVNLMSGKIGVTRNELNQTVFWFTIPLKRMSERLPAPQVKFSEMYIYNLSSASMQFVNTFGQQNKIKIISYNSKSNLKPDSVVVFDNIEDQEVLKEYVCNKIVIPQLVSTSLFMSALAELRPTNSGQVEVVNTNENLPVSNNQEKICRISILLVEDNITNQILAQELLERKGYRVTIANDGEEAISKIKEISFDVVLMDCQMPIKDGFEATIEIRRDQKKYPINNKLPIIAMTANAMKSDFEKCIAVGMNNYISKPFDIEDLDQLIKKELIENNFFTRCDLLPDKNLLIVKKHIDDLENEIKKIERNSNLDKYFEFKEKLFSNFKTSNTSRFNYYFLGFENGVNDKNAVNEINFNLQKDRVLELLKAINVGEG